jgi:DNA (cytosine-5)-methyltransferase 1
VTTQTKPLYAIPPKQEIFDTPQNGLTVLSTFTGTGGSCLGYRWAGYETLGASEFVEAAADSYRANFGPDVPIDTRDIRNIHGDDLVGMAQTAFEQNHPDRPWPGVDVIEGSPPCSAFSMSGARSRLWGTEAKPYSDTYVKDVEDLFFDFARIVDEIQPKAFTAENVPGLISGVARGYYFEIRDAFVAAGYRVGAKVLDASYLGVPQARRRLIFIGIRNDLDLDPQFPEPLPYRYSMEEAFVDVPDPDGEDEIARSFEAYSIYPYWRALGYGEAPKRSRFNLIRCNPYQPAPTILATSTDPGSTSPTRWDEPRKFHIPELKRLSGFPDDWALTGNYIKRSERLARAVPPPMAKAIAESVAETIA